jgi:hypothetical protein
MKTLWGRDRFNSKKKSVVRDIDQIYVGHTPTTHVLDLGNVRYIDTGCGYNFGKLTMEEIQ